MRKSRFSEEQIVRIIQEYAAGAKVSELCRKHGIGLCRMPPFTNGKPGMAAFRFPMSGG